MTERWHFVILGIALALSILGLGALEIVAERPRPDLQQAERLNRSDEAQPRPAALASFEPEAREAPWTPHLRRVEDALAREHVSAAQQAWRDAYGEAFRSRRWEGLLEVGDAYLRIGEVAKTQKTAEATARRIYLVALFRAHQQGLPEGVLRIAEAFARLGDREVVEQSLRVAELLAVRDSRAQTDVRAFRERWIEPGNSIARPVLGSEDRTRGATVLP